MLAIAIVLFAASGSGALDYNRLFEPGTHQIFLWIIWIVLAVGILSRIVPNTRISLGSRKHFACTYEPAATHDFSLQEKHALRKSMNKGALLSILSWFAITSTALLALYFFGVLTPAIVLIIALIFGALDRIFVTILCPFQRLFMKNRCCIVCRIYNWDHLMMCLPLVLFPSFFSLTLAGLAIVAVTQWELALWKNPQFFSVETNRNLRCGSCTEKLCQFKNLGG